MSVSDHDTTVVVTLAVLRLAAGVAVALVIVARSTDGAVAHLAETARTLGAGDLDGARGELGAGPELETLGAHA